MHITNHTIKCGQSSARRRMEPDGRWHRSGTDGAHGVARLTYL